MSILFDHSALLATLLIDLFHWTSVYHCNFILVKNGEDHGIMEPIRQKCIAFINVVYRGFEVYDIPRCYLH